MKIRINRGQLGLRSMVEPKGCLGGKYPLTVLKKMVIGIRQKLRFGVGPSFFSLIPACKLIFNFSKTVSLC